MPRVSTLMQKDWTPFFQLHDRITKFFQNRCLKTEIKTVVRNGHWGR
ncbi:MAG: hypothetical protein VSS75_006030 [Candidatus Parabeggiatoa sp.]|nr:hypothetical protein [Candidatus Parabeggiatoa sp.]